MRGGHSPRRGRGRQGGAGRDATDVAGEGRQAIEPRLPLPLGPTARRQGPPPKVSLDRRGVGPVGPGSFQNWREGGLGATPPPPTPTPGTCGFLTLSIPAWITRL